MAAGTYRIKAGDTLSSIARSVYGDASAWPAIAAANRLPNPDLIYVGAQLVIPPQATGSTRQEPASPPVRSPGTQATQPARHVAYPPVSYVLDRDLMAATIRGNGMTIKVKLVGTVKLEIQKPLLELNFSSNKVSTAVKSEYDSRLVRATADVKVSYSAVAGKLDLSCGLTTASKVGGEIMHLQQAKYEPPNKFVYRSTPRPVEGKLGDMLFQGTIAAVVEITMDAPRPEAMRFPTRQAAFVMSPQSQQAFMVVAAVLLIAATCISAPITLGAAATAGVASFVLVNFATAKRDMGYL